MDDSIFSRGCSKKVELLTKIFDHAIVFMRYVMLAVENRESEDPRTLGELFTYFMNEMADVTFLKAFKQIMSLFSKMMTEKFDLDEEEISKMIDTFIAALTPSMQRQLKAA